MTTTTGEGGANHAPQLAVWRALALVFTALILMHVALHVWQFSGHTEMFGRTGLPTHISAGPNGTLIVPKVVPGSSAERTGIQAGDSIVYDDRVDNLRNSLHGETIGMTVGTGAAARHVTLTAEPFAGHINWPYEAADLVFLTGALLGGVIILRSGARRSSLLLGVALVSYAVTGQWPRMWEGTTHESFTAAYVALSYIYYGSSALMLLATRALRQEASGRDPAILRVVSYAVLLVHAVLIPVMCWNEMSPSGSIWLSSHTYLVYTAPVFAEYALATLTLVLAGREVAATDRSRYGMMLCALLLIIAAGIIDGIILATGNDYLTVRPLLVSWYAALFAGVLLFAYAILRHRVIDLGFAVNQTLIYGLVSFVVLLLFGLAEWGVEKIMPEAWREHVEANSLISAAIALAIFLVFHRIRDGVEEVIEGIFFHKWRQNEALLGRFVAQAAHIVRPEALKTATVTEFERFSGGAQVAMYRADATRMVREAGALSGLDATLDIDLPTLVALRAEGKVLFDADAAPLHAALILPMFQRNDLTGFIAVAPRPAGDAYRPDERSALAAAAQKIGLDLHALRIEELETDLAGAQLAVTELRRLLLPA